MNGYNFSVSQIASAGGAILGLLVVLSIYSLGLMWERWSYFHRCMRGMRPFLDRVRSAMAKGDLSAIMNLCRQNKGPAVDIIMASLVGPTSKEDRKRSAERTLEKQTALLERGLSSLGTIGSTAPFIGLFGTVLGVMRAFHDLAGTAGAGPGVVAMGIAEALITTAAGLFVAIPAIIGYNYFTHRSSRFSEELRWVTDEILDRLTETAAK